MDTANSLESLSWPNREQGAPWQAHPLGDRSQIENSLTGYKAKFLGQITRQNKRNQIETEKQNLGYSPNNQESLF